MPVLSSFSFEGLADALVADAARGERIVVAVAGEPGVGKSTFVETLSARLAARGRRVGVIPMDGFHLADRALRALGRLERKGAIDTFDAAGYLSALRRVRTGEAGAIYVPCFERELEQPIAGALPIEPDCEIVLTEGNYLLDEDAPWRDARALFDHAWFLTAADDETRRTRLVERHIRFGKEPEQARRWVSEVDEVNAERIRRSASRADRLLVIGD
jgi:pantothenate kinase